jgi:hypothetical protein
VSDALENEIVGVLRAILETLERIEELLRKDELL